MFLLEKRKSRKEEEIPVERVKELSSRGLSEHEIVSVLRKQGYSPYQIERAISSTLKNTVSEFSTPEKIVPGKMIREKIEPIRFSAPPQFPMEEYPPKEKKMPEFYTVQSPSFEQEGFPLAETQKEEKDELMPSSIYAEESASKNEKNLPEFTFEESPQEIFEKPEMPSPEEGGEEAPEITIEEIVEGIVTEKWQHFEEIVTQLKNADNEIRKEVAKLKEEVESIKNSMRKSEETLAGKLEEHGEHVATIEARISSIERVFKEFLPELTENIKLLKEVIEKRKS